MGRTDCPLPSPLAGQPLEISLLNSAVSSVPWRRLTGGGQCLWPPRTQRYATVMASANGFNHCLFLRPEDLYTPFKHTKQAGVLFGESRYTHPCLIRGPSLPIQVVSTYMKVSLYIRSTAPSFTACLLSGATREACVRSQ